MEIIDETKHDLFLGMSRAEAFSLEWALQSIKMTASSIDLPENHNTRNCTAVHDRLLQMLRAGAM